MGRTTIRNYRRKLAAILRATAQRLDPQPAMTYQPQDGSYLISLPRPGGSALPLTRITMDNLSDQRPAIPPARAAGVSGGTA